MNKQERVSETYNYMVDSEEALDVVYEREDDYVELDFNEA